MQLNAGPVNGTALNAGYDLTLIVAMAALQAPTDTLATVVNSGIGRHTGSGALSAHATTSSLTAH